MVVRLGQYAKVNRRISKLAATPQLRDSAKELIINQSDLNKLNTIMPPLWGLFDACHILL